MQDQKRKNKYAQEETRFRIVDYLKNKRGTQKQAAKIFGVTERAVNKIWNKYKTEGKRSLLSKKRGVKEGKKVNGMQVAEVRTLVKDKLPNQLKLPYGLWTREAVQQLIEKRYGISLNVKQVGRYLSPGDIRLKKTHTQSL
ncbi:MAG: helix-turn-helix domain-containing protein [Bacteroidetes bacterium]|nr:helix-turn-helix domain-containing protein [Bacteroidota bacterium]